MPEFGRSFIPAVVLILRKLVPLLAMLGVSLAIAAPSAAARLHGLEHFTTQVAAGQHHHHKTDGSVELHQDEPDQESDQDSDANGVGHSHASGAAGEVIKTAAAVTPVEPPQEAQRVHPGEHKLPALEPPPGERPPRTA